MPLSQHAQGAAIDYSIYREMPGWELDDEGDCPDDNHINQKSDWLEEASVWLNKARKECEWMEQELKRQDELQNQIRLQLDDLWNRIYSLTIEASIKKTSQKQYQRNIQVITMRIPIKNARKLKRTA